MKFKNYRNPYTNDNRIYSFKDLYNMPFGELIRNKQEVLGQYRVLGVPTEQELQGSENVIWVEAYTRDDGTEVRGHWRSRPEGSSSEPDNNHTTKDVTKENKQGDLTGGASEVKQEIKEQKYVPEMTKSAKLQEIVAKNNPIANNFPEQEYYKISLNLDKVRKTGEIPNWMKEHNDIRTLEQIGNKNLAYKIKEKIIKEAKTNNDVETINNPDNVFVITAKPSSDLTNFVINDSKFNETLENKLSEISNGKYKDSYFSFEFKNKENFKDKDKNFSTNHTIGRCDVHNIKIEPDGEISATIIDYYDFSKNGGFINNNANLQQQNKKLENYALVIPIRMKIKKKR